MNSYKKKNVVVVVFPTSDAKTPPKKRPALVLRKNGSEDLLLCMMTTVRRDEPEEVFVKTGEANLKKDTYIRTHKMMTVHESFVSSALGSVTDETWDTVIETIKAWL